MREKRAKETAEEKRIKHAIKHSSNQRDQGKTNSWGKVCRTKKKMPIESERPGKIKQMKKRYTECVKIPIESGREG